MLWTIFGNELGKHTVQHSRNPGSPMSTGHSWVLMLHTDWIMCPRLSARWLIKSRCSPLLLFSESWKASSTLSSSVELEFEWGFAPMMMVAEVFVSFSPPDLWELSCRFLVEAFEAASPGFFFLFFFFWNESILRRQEPWVGIVFSVSQNRLAGTSAVT